MFTTIYIFTSRDFYTVPHSGGSCRLSREGHVPSEKIFAVIDHHDCSKVPDADFVDCREVGAISTILAEYLKEGAGKYFDRSSLEMLYPLLYMGVQIDTNYLRDGATEKDIEMIKTYAHEVDYNNIIPFSKFKRSSFWMDAYGRAYSTREPAYERANIASVGKINTKKIGDPISVAANDLLKEDKIHTVYLVGFDNQYVDLVMRSEDCLADCDKLMHYFPGSIGGGRKCAARIQIPTSNFFSTTKYMSCVDYAERVIKDKIKDGLIYSLKEVAQGKL